MGFPVVKVTEVEGGIHVRQDRFLETGPAEAKDNETIWSIPLSLLTTDANGQPKVDHSLLLDEREKFIPLDTSKPFKLNAGTVSVFRVLYSPERLVAIAKEAAKENSVFSTEDRVGLVYDALALAKAGYLEVSSMLALFDAFRNDKDYLVWKGIGDGLSSLVSTWYEHADIVDNLNKFRRELFSPLVKQLGYEYPKDESVDKCELRTAAVRQAAQAGDEVVIAELLARFRKAVETGDDSHIPPDLVRTTYRISVEHGGRAEYDVVKAIAEKPKNPSVGVSAMWALGAPADLALAEETWDIVMNKTRDQNLYVYFVAFSDNFTKRHFIAEKFKANYQALFDRLAGNYGMQQLVKWTFSAFSSEKDYEETKAFFEDKDTSKYIMNLKQALDGIRSRAAWIDRSSDDIRRWIAKQKSQL